MQRSRSARHGHGVGHAHPPGQVGFEHVDMGSQRRHPTRVQGLEEQLPFLVADVRGREIDAAHAGARGPGDSAPQAAATATTSAVATTTATTGPARVCAWDAPTAAAANTASPPM